MQKAEKYLELIRLQGDLGIGVKELWEHYGLNFSNSSPLNFSIFSAVKFSNHSALERPIRFEPNDGHRYNDCFCVAPTELEWIFVRFYYKGFVPTGLHLSAL